MKRSVLNQSLCANFLPPRLLQWPDIVRLLVIGDVSLLWRVQVVGPWGILKVPMPVLSILGAMDHDVGAVPDPLDVDGVLNIMRQNRRIFNDMFFSFTYE